MEDGRAALGLVGTERLVVPPVKSEIVKHYAETHGVSWITNSAPQTCFGSPEDNRKHEC
jgi:hypothetical protein